MEFPIFGIDVSGGFTQQRPGTTPVGVNCRAWDALLMRGRGGSRPGLAKYIPAQLPTGAKLVQELAAPVVASASAVSGTSGIYVAQANYASVASATTVTVNLPAPVAAGQIIVVFVSRDDFHTPLGAGDNFLSVYSAFSQGLQDTNHTMNFAWAYAGDSGTLGVAVSWPNACKATVGVVILGNPKATSALDGFVTHYPNVGPNVSTGNITLSSTGEMLLGAFGQGQGNYAFTPTTGNLCVNQPDGATTEALYVVDLLSNGSTPITGTFPGAVNLGVENYGLSFLSAPSPASTQQSSSGRLVKIVAVSEGQVYYANAGASSWSSPTNSTGANPPLSTPAVQPVVRSAQNGNYLYFADGSRYVRYALLTDALENWTASAGSLPADGIYRPRLICNWRDRIVLSGIIPTPYDVFFSATGDPTDWDYSPVNPSPDQAVSLSASSLGVVGDTVTGLAPWTDDLLVIFCTHSTWLMQGDPGFGGSLQLVSPVIGGAWGIPWCVGPDGTMYFFSARTGVYQMQRGGQPQRISQQIESLLLPLDTGAKTVRMAWNERWQGIDVYVTTSASQSSDTHYFWESRTNAWWQVVHGSDQLDPQCLCVLDGNSPSDRVVLIGSWDGTVRCYSSSATTDDGNPFASSVFVGPLLNKLQDDWVLKELQAVLGETSGSVNFDVYVGRTAEGALAAPAVASGTWAGGRNYLSPVRRAGHAAWVKLSSTNQWGYETIRAIIQGQGRIRRRNPF